MKNKGGENPPNLPRKVSDNVLKTMFEQFDSDCEKGVVTTRVESGNRIYSIENEDSCAIMEVKINDSFFYKFETLRYLIHNDLIKILSITFHY